MPDLGPLGRGGARRRTRRRMGAMEGNNNVEESSDNLEVPQSSDKLEKLAKLLKDKGVISQEEFNLIFD